MAVTVKDGFWIIKSELSDSFCRLKCYDSHQHCSCVRAGVASFTIDYAAKKVTIVGDVTPSGVLASVSKIKSAQFWTSATPAAASDNTEVSKK